MGGKPKEEEGKEIGFFAGADISGHFKRFIERNTLGGENRQCKDTGFAHFTIGPERFAKLRVFTHSLCNLLYLRELQSENDFEGGSRLSQCIGDDAIAKGEEFVFDFLDCHFI